MDQFPRTTVAGISLPRMLIGSNWVLGFSHRTTSADNMIKHRYSNKEAVCDLICAYLEYGVDAMMAPFVGDDMQPNAVVMYGIHMAEDKMGRKVILIDTPIINVTNTPEAHDFTARKIEAVRKNGADFCLLHHSSVEQLVCKHTGTIDRLEEYTKMIRDNNMIPGLSAHMPELILYSDEQGYDVETYIQLYNCMGFLMQVEIEYINKVIWNAKKPVMTIKPMAAGRCSPFVGLTFSFATLRPCDMVTVGCLTPEEAAEDIEIGMAAIERRQPDLEGRSSPARADSAVMPK